MKSVYNSPWRVYLFLGLFAVLGIYAGFDLPISLYPNSNRPTIQTGVSYGSSTSQEFIDNYGSQIEASLKAINRGNLKVEKVEANYEKSSVYYKVDFTWGADPKDALREVESNMNSLSSRWSKEIRDSLWVNFWSKSSGFIAISFFSSKHSPDQLYSILEPEFTPKLLEVEDAAEAVLWNPSQQEIKIVLRPDTIALLGIFPRDVQEAFNSARMDISGGTLQVGERQLSITAPRFANDLDLLKKIPVKTRNGDFVLLEQIADIQAQSGTENSKVFKTNGSAGLILFGSPKTGGNVKKMAEDILAIVLKVMPRLPKEIDYRVLVDPSEFIRESISNVMREVFLAAGLAVFVLFLFIGSVKNTVTAALEIPLSMVLAFILMKISGMNINLISLGGLALSAGMNVDASVVVMENIFRYMEENPGILSLKARIDMVVRAVKEVALPVIGSTVASLVVFIPLAFTSDLANAILGDLAKAVVFSHGCSAIVALILVPTIRLHLMARSRGSEKPPRSPIDKHIKKLEDLYERALTFLLNAKRLRLAIYTGVTISLVLLLTLVAPRLKTEIIGLPDTDWIILGVNTHGNSLVKQMEAKTDEIEAQMLAHFGEKIAYTFVQVRRPNNSTIMARLKNKSDMDEVWKKFQEHFANTPEINFWVIPWNPAELPIPDPADFEVTIMGGTPEERAMVSSELVSEINRNDIYSNTWDSPSSNPKDGLVLGFNWSNWPDLVRAGAHFSPSDLLDLARVATDGKSIGSMSIDSNGQKEVNVALKFPFQYLNSKSNFAALPILVGDKLIPLKALVNIELKKIPPERMRINGQEVSKVFGKVKKGEEGLSKKKAEQANLMLDKFNLNFKKDLELKSNPVIIHEDAKKELNDALKQLSVAILLSIILMALTLFYQFGNFVQSLIVLTAIPFGMIGVVVSLFIFGSSLSLNSALGVILLNGISVANSIILVDFMLKLVERGLDPVSAALVAAKKRLRPILITSLTTILGMLPIAIGLGEGGKILRPLGIAVSGGLWSSMLFTLFLVPALEVAYLKYKLKKTSSTDSLEIEHEEAQLRKKLQQSFPVPEQQPLWTTSDTTEVELPQ